MSLPIIFLNYGNPEYLKYALTQCKGTNPNARVILIGDSSNYGYAGVEHHQIKDYTETATAFEQSYIHLSSNPPKFEMFCIQRWMMIYEFMKKNNIPQCFILDSDVLLYEPIQLYANFFGNAEMTLYEINTKAYHVTAGSTFVFNINILKDFCDFCVAAYKDKTVTPFTEMQNHYFNLVNNGKPGGVCDMTLWALFYESHRNRIDNTQKVFNGNIYFDIYISDTQIPDYTFNSENGIKKIDFKHNIPYCIAHKHSTNTDVEIRLPCLHFQGSAKSLMPQYTKYRGYYYLYNIYFIAFKNKVNRLIGR